MVKETEKQKQKRLGIDQVNKALINRTDTV